MKLTETWNKSLLQFASLKTWSNSRYEDASLGDADQYLTNLKTNFTELIKLKAMYT